MEGEIEIIDNTDRGLMIGRFQPFHNGHLKLAIQILADCEELVVAIGSPGTNFSFNDPFTSGERITMIHESLKYHGLDMSKCYILPVPNSSNNYTWFAQIKSMIPRVATIYSGNEFVRLLLPADMHIRSPSFIRIKVFNGTRIRNLMARNGRWENLVPSPVVSFIREIDGISRLRKLKATELEQWKVMGT